jgi:hypothetical protein
MHKKITFIPFFPNLFNLCIRQYYRVADNVHGCVSQLISNLVYLNAFPFVTLE